jgi:hypothetical protein
MRKGNRLSAARAEVAMRFAPANANLRILAEDKRHVGGA